MLQATFWLFFCWDILVSARYEVGRKKFGQKVPNVLRMVGRGVFLPPPRSAQRVPEPDPIPGISFDTRPDSVWKIIG